MTGMKLVIPDASMSPEIVAYRQAMLDAGSSMDGCGKLRRLANPADWLAFNEAFSKKETAPAGWGRPRSTSMSARRTGASSACCRCAGR